MIEAQEHNSFFFLDKRLKNLQELVDVLRNPEYNDAIRNHIGENHNHFANWVRDVLLERELADEMNKEKEIQKIAELLETKIAQENTPLISDKPQEVKEITFEPHAEVNTEEIEKVYFDTMKKTTEENIKEEEISELRKKTEENEPDLNLKKETQKHVDISETSKNPRYYCPKFYECMKKEFMIGIGIGIFIGIIIAVLARIGGL